LELTSEAARALGFEPRLSFNGPIDTFVTDERLADDVVATLREALSNVAQHARAARVEIDLTVTGETLVLEVRDDGIGFARSTSARGGGHGMRNMQSRAEDHGGELTVEPAPDSGTILVWRVSLS
jgi:signal transduction histidine kinase